MKITSSLFFAFATLLLFSGCGNYVATTKEARDDFYSGKYGEAAEKLKKGASEEGVNQILYLLDRATALHHLGEFEQSIRDFELAEKLAEQKDYTSISTEALTLLTNDRILPYKGEDFEKILISQYQALNYLMLGKAEDSLVECRRVNHKTQMYISQGKKAFKLSPMAVYLSALIYEDKKNWDDAYIDYQTTYKLLPSLSLLREDLYRLAVKNKIFQGSASAETWAQTFSLSDEEKKKILEDAKNPEIVVLLENGKSPEKHPHPSWYALPHYLGRENPSAYGSVWINDQKMGETLRLYDVEKTAIETLNEKMDVILAKRIGGVVAKEVIGHQVGKKTNPVVGDLAKLGLYLADQADLRSWLTLPKDFQIFRARIKPGQTYKIAVELKSFSNQSLGFVKDSAGKKLEKLVVLGANKNEKIFLIFRSE